MKTEATTFDRIVQKIKDNRIIACILIFGTLVIVFSQFTDATEKIINIFLANLLLLIFRVLGKLKC